MATKSGSDKQSGSTSPITDDGEKDRLIAGLKNRVAVLENELRLKQDISSRDIERGLAEDALRESEERFRNVFENAATGILIADVNRGYMAVNDRFCDITGYSRNKLLTMGCEQIVHPDDQAADIAEVQRLIRGEASSFIRDLRYVHANGRIVWARVNVSLMRTNNRKEPRIVAVVEDITERKQTEEELKEAKSRAELYLDLMGHDINNMHQIALGYLELARDMNPEAGPNEFIDKPVEVLQRSAQLIRNVRKLQRLREGMFQTQDVDVIKVISEVQQEFGAITHKAIAVNLNGCDHCHVRANELLHDVFTNLVSNAIKHTGDSADITIGLDIVNDNDCRYCRVSVEDHGPGVPDDFKGRLFNRMMKGTSKAKGMGLGLFLVKSLVESYGGRVWVEDRLPGDHTKGARFVVMLPVVDN